MLSALLNKFNTYSIIHLFIYKIIEDKLFFYKIYIVGFLGGMADGSKFSHQQSPVAYSIIHSFIYKIIEDKLFVYKICVAFF